jgi:hypothetical protein
VRQMMVEQHRRMRRDIEVVQLAVTRGRLHRSLPGCSGGRTRASRGKPIRRRGSRRTAGATRAGPRSSDPDLGEPPSRHRRAVA